MLHIVTVDQINISVMTRKHCREFQLMRRWTKNSLSGRNDLHKNENTHIRNSVLLHYSM